MYEDGLLKRGVDTGWILSILSMVALKFNENINRRDLDGLVKLMTSDHTFINSEGEVHEGREVMSARVITPESGDISRNSLSF